MAKKEKGPKWYLRLFKRMMGEGMTKKEAHNALAGEGKHTRQRVRAPGYWERVRELQRRRKAQKRKILMRARGNAKLVRNRKRRRAKRR